MGNPEFIILQPNPDGTISKSEIRRVIQLLKDNEVDPIPALSELIHVPERELLQNGTVECLSIMAESELMDLLCNIIAKNTDLKLVNMALLLMWLLCNPIIVGDGSQEYKIKSVSECLIRACSSQNPVLHQAGMLAMRSWLQSEPNHMQDIASSGIVTAMGKELTGEKSGKEKLMILAIIKLLVKNGMAGPEMEAVIKIVSSVEEEAEKKREELKDDEKQAEDWDLVGDEANLVLRCWRRVKSQPTTTAAVEREKEKEKQDALKAQEAKMERDKDEALRNLTQMKNEEKEREKAELTRLKDACIQSIENDKAALQASLNAQQAEIEKLKKQLPPPVEKETQLSRVPKRMSDGDPFNISGNTITLKQDSWYTIALGPAMTTGVHRFVFKTTRVSANCCRLGLYDTSKPFPQKGNSLESNNAGVGVDLATGCHYLQCTTHTTGGHTLTPTVHNGSIVKIEVDLRPGGERTAHWFINDQQQKPYVRKVPASVQFALNFYSPSVAYDFVSIESNCTPEAKPIPNEQAHDW